MRIYPDYSAPFKWLCATGFALMVTGWILNFRMAVQVNRALPPEKRIPPLEFGYRVKEIKRLHEQLYPASETLRTTSASLMAVAGVLFGIAVLIEIRPR